MEYSEIIFGKLYYNHANGPLENGRKLFITFTEKGNSADVRAIQYFRDGTLEINPIFNSATYHFANEFFRKFNAHIGTDVEYRFLIKKLFESRKKYEI